VLATAGPGGTFPRTILVTSASPGDGKTMTAVNLAALLAESAPGEVALLDLDLQFGDVSAVLDVEPESSVADAFASGADDSMLLRTLLMPHPAQFYILCGADHPAGVGRVTGDEIRKLVNQFATSFRYVVIDTSGGLQEETLASLEEATDVVFVTALDVATLRAVRKEVDVLAELGLLPQRRHVVLNRADRMFGLTVRDAERILGLPVDAVIPASDLVALAANHGGLAIEATKKNLVRKPLQRLAENVSDLIELNITHKGEELP
jgi:pilus assembly protein CpaE